ncbi:MAG TPA: APC family permease [Bryobacteraceae bacterium]|jgi:amino acid transporter|nr:APC family permease [Bryobacteraceae bacterium]
MNLQTPASSAGQSSSTTKVVVATTVALTFISVWQAAAVVLNDMASTMYYIGGIAEQAIGKSAPWMVLAVMLFSYLVRSVYMESSSMFVRGGVYVVVRDSMGPTVAKLSVSALVVDYILTGPISVVSAGQYLGRLLNELSEALHQTWRTNPNYFAVFFSVVVTGYFWWSNIKGVPESSTKALRIMQITTVMVVILLVWCPLTLVMRGNSTLPPPPTPSNIHLTNESLGWLRGTFWAQLSFVVLIVAFGHSILAMSGFETLAQVYREIAYPKLKNLRLTANIVCTYCLICTGVISVFAVMIIPDAVRSTYYDNLIGGVVDNLVGPVAVKLGFHIFVVVVGVLILAGAVNTSLIGVNGVMNRVAEDGVLLDWFRRPHTKFGTTYRILNTMALLQIATIIASRGDVLLLGEAYAFGVVWSFALKALGVLVLRYQRHDQEYKFPGNITLGRVEIPIGLAATTSILFLVAIANLFTKKIATIYGVSFTIVLYALFLVSEHVNARKKKEHRADLEKFNLDHQPDISAQTLHARPGSILVAVRDSRRLWHLSKALEKTNLRRHDIVVMTVRPLSTGAAEYELRDEQLFARDEQELFSHVVSVAEKEGKSVELLVVPAVDPFDAMVQTASQIQASKLVVGVSARMASEELASRIGLAWERLPEPRHAFSLEITNPDRPSVYVNLGPHPPRLWPEDVDRLHRIWLRLCAQSGVGSRLHHRDVVGVALRRLEHDLESSHRGDVLDSLQHEIHKSDGT